MAFETGVPVSGKVPTPVPLRDGVGQIVRGDIFAATENILGLGGGREQGARAPVRGDTLDKVREAAMGALEAGLSSMKSAGPELKPAPREVVVADAAGPAVRAK